MAHISTLIKDIYEVLASPIGEAEARELALQTGSTAGHKLIRQLTRTERKRKERVIYPSEIGSPCSRRTVYEYDLGTGLLTPSGLRYPPEELSGPTRLKFQYGDMIESMIIPLCAVAGHEVTHVDHQIKWEVPGVLGGWLVSGRVDLVIDGHVVDVKSMAARSFDKWDTQGAAGADTFGYSYQVAAYKYGIPEASDKPGYILGVDKEGGKLLLAETVAVDVAAAAEKTVGVITGAGYPRRRLPVDAGGSGNKKLDVVCSYCRFKQDCWSHTNGGRGLRTFIYSKGPEFLTEVVREPKVPEAT